MTLKTQITADLPVFFETDDFAEAVTYNGTSIDAVVTPKKQMDEITGSVVSVVELIVKKSDVNWPRYNGLGGDGDTVEIPSLTGSLTDEDGGVIDFGGVDVGLSSDPWRVRWIMSGDEDTWTLECWQTERPVI